MHSKFLVAALTAAIIGVCTLAPAAKAQPLNILQWSPATTVVAAPAIGAGVGYGVGEVFLRHGSHLGRTALMHIGGLGGATVIGFIGGVTALVGYEAIGCKTFHTDPLGICVHHSWRQ